MMIRAEQDQLHQVIVAAPGKVDDVVSFGGRYAINHRTVKSTKLAAPGIAVMQFLDQLPVAGGQRQQAAAPVLGRAGMVAPQHFFIDLVALCQSAFQLVFVRYIEGTLFRRDCSRELFQQGICCWSNTPDGLTGLRECRRRAIGQRAGNQRQVLEKLECFIGSDLRANLEISRQRQVSPYPVIPILVSRRVDRLGPNDQPGSKVIPRRVFQNGEQPKTFSWLNGRVQTGLARVGLSQGKGKQGLS
jgi:hypothetical protein